MVIRQDSEALAAQPVHEAYSEANLNGSLVPTLKVFPVEQKPELKQIFTPTFEFGQYRFVVRLADYTSCFDCNVRAFRLRQYFEHSSDSTCPGEVLL